MFKFKCPITDIEAERIDANLYKIKVNGGYTFIEHGIRFDALVQKEDFQKNKYIFAGAILNRQLIEKRHDVDYFSITISNYQEKLKKIIYPKNPKSKLDNLFKSLFNMQKFEGEEVNMMETLYSETSPAFYYKHFFKSLDECVYYIKELDNQGLIKCSIMNYNTVTYFNITFEGLNYYLKLTESGEQSSKCFVAMSFDSEMRETREAIRQVIEKNDFETILIDEQLISSSQTINDAIIAAIKSCKFCIADFSQQKDGVYFESGYAVGLGKPVIYTCNKGWFDKSHFDTNHFPHIIYESDEELKNLLDARIKAWIKD